MALKYACFVTGTDTGIGKTVFSAGLSARLGASYWKPIQAGLEGETDRETVARIDRLLNIAEYKRRQSAPGVKVTLRNFGRDRRYPITNRFRDSGKPLAKPDETLTVRAAQASTESIDV